MYIFGLIAYLLALAIAGYLAYCYHRQSHKNRTTLFWSLGFLSAAVSIWCATQISFQEVIPLPASQIGYQFGQYFFASLALLLIYLGVSRLINSHFFYSLILPLTIFIVHSAWAGGKILHIQTIEALTLLDTVFVFGVLLPLGLLLTSVFGRLFWQLRSLQQFSESRWGALIMSIGWLLFCLIAVGLLFVWDRHAMELWFGGLGIVELVIFIGIGLLQEGAGQEFDFHKKVHGLEEKRD